MQGTTIKPWLAAGAIAVLAIWLVSHNSEDPVAEAPAVATASSPRAPVRQQVQAETVQANPGRQGRHSIADMTRGEPMHVDPKLVMAAEVAELDQRMRAEPVNRQWAMEQSAVIERAIVGQPNDGFDVPMPESFQEQCHSSLCRISMVYADEEDAIQMRMKLGLGLRGPIATNRTFFMPTKNGSMEVVVFAGNPDRLF